MSTFEFDAFLSYSTLTERLGPDATQLKGRLIFVQRDEHFLGVRAEGVTVKGEGRYGDLCRCLHHSASCDWQSLASGVRACRHHRDTS
jgi:hypothetical protein